MVGRGSSEVRGKGKDRVLGQGLVERRLRNGAIKKGKVR